MSKTRVVVTGARGLLGSALIPYLKSSGYEVIAIAGRGTSGRNADLSQPEVVHQQMNAARPHVIVNLAALTNVDYCENHPGEAYRVNAGIVLNLVRWIESSRSSCHLIQISTDQVYDGPGPHLEGAICPINYYAYSKCLADEYVHRVSGTSLRTNFFGKSCCSGRASLSDWVVSSLRSDRGIVVFDDVFFSPLSLDTLISLIERVVAKRANGVFNLGSSMGMSKADFAFALASTAGLSSVSCLTRGSIANVQGLIARRPLDMRMNSQLFETTFDIQLPELADEIRKVGGGYRNESI